MNGFSQELVFVSPKAAAAAAAAALLEAGADPRRLLHPRRSYRIEFVSNKKPTASEVSLFGARTVKTREKFGFCLALTHFCALCFRECCWVKQPSLL